MELWTEYEGRTIAGTHTLTRLLRSEGRNAFFATASQAGPGELMRLTEAHFDEAETLMRWRRVAKVEQSHLVGIGRVGQTVVDGVSLTYALLERSDGTLDEVLCERPLTVAETLEVGRSVVEALAALHASGLVHEHIEPANVMAMGEVVKLRSDCVRECVADVEFNTAEGRAALVREDVRAVGLLLVRCVTLERAWKPGLVLAEPLGEVVRRALDGSWGLAEMAAALKPVGVAGEVDEARAAKARAVAPAAVAEGLRARATEVRRVAPVQGSQARKVVRVAETRALAGRKGWYVAVAVLLVLLGWWMTGRTHGKAVTPVLPLAAPVVVPASAPVAALAVAPAAAGWYVVAYTYKREDQAWRQVQRVREGHGGLQPGMLKAGGAFLVVLGGGMLEEEARGMVKRARRAGMPRDMVVRRF